MKKNKLIKELEKIPGNPDVCIKFGPPMNMLSGLLTIEQYKLHVLSKEVIVLSDINPNWKEEDPE